MPGSLPGIFSITCRSIAVAADPALLLILLHLDRFQPFVGQTFIRAFLHFIRGNEEEG